MTDIYKIVAITASDLNLQDAPKHHFVAMVSSLRRIGHDVYVIAPVGTRGALFDGEHFFGYKAPKEFGPFIYRALGQISLFKKLLYVKRYLNPDIYYVRLSASMIAPGLFSRLFRKKLVSELNGFIFEGKRKKIQPKNLIWLIHEWFMCRSSRHVIAIKTCF